MPPIQETGATMTCSIGKEQLIYVVDEIFRSMAGMELTPSLRPMVLDRQRGYVVSAVQIVGNWQGAVRLDIDLELCRLVCARFLGVEPCDLSADDIRDAAGELANITGGSVKALIAPTCGLSLPSVVMGWNYEFSVLQGKVIQESSFLHDSGQLLVSVLEKQGVS
jgi:chemotaxis protein CheX